MSSTQQIKRLQFANAAAIVAAFQAGAVFAVTRPGHALDRVTSIEQSRAERASGFHVMRIRTEGGESYHNFNVAGEHADFKTHRLVQIEEVQRNPGFNLEALLKGEKFVCPKTGEVVAAVHAFRPEVPGVSPALEVEFVGGRTSDNYRLDGTHRHDAARDLTPQPPVPKTKTLRVEVAREDKAPHRIQAMVFTVTPSAVKRNAGESMHRGMAGVWTVVAAHEFEVPA